jgi:hypothetical protein
MHSVFVIHRLFVLNGTVQSRIVVRSTDKESYLRTRTAMTNSQGFRRPPAAAIAVDGWRCYRAHRVQFAPNELVTPMRFEPAHQVGAPADTRPEQDRPPPRAELVWVDDPVQLGAHTDRQVLDPPEAPPRTAGGTTPVRRARAMGAAAGDGSLGRASRGCGWACSLVITRPGVLAASNAVGGLPTIRQAGHEHAPTR